MYSYYGRHRSGDWWTYRDYGDLWTFRYSGRHRLGYWRTYSRYSRHRLGHWRTYRYTDTTFIVTGGRTVTMGAAI